MKMENEFSCHFGHNIISNGLYQAIRIKIVAKKTELVILFHKKTSKLVFLWPNFSQLCLKVLSKHVLYLRRHFLLSTLKKCTLGVYSATHYVQCGALYVFEKHFVRYLVVIVTENTTHGVYLSR